MERYLQTKLEALETAGNRRRLPQIGHDGIYVLHRGRKMLNLSSNDYLGLAADAELRNGFLERLQAEDFIPTASSSRLLTGNFEAYETLERQLASLYESEAALVFNSGYHANSGILPALADERSLILADKLVHASLIDGIRLSGARAVRFRHNDYEQLERLLEQYHRQYERIFVATESIFSMDGDCCDLPRLAALKQRYDNVFLYLDEAHAVGVRGERGLGCAEEAGVLPEIDLLVGTFGKALASVGAYLIASKTVCDLLINRMRPLIYTTALPPVNLKWSHYILERIPHMQERRLRLERLSAILREVLPKTGKPTETGSHIVPLVAGKSREALRLAEQVQQLGYYVLPVRPPTVPEGTARLRFSLSAALPEEDIKHLSEWMKTSIF